MTHKINNMDLNNKDQGWTLLRGSIPISGLEYAAPALDMPGRDGTVMLPASRRPVTFQYNIKSRLATRPVLMALFGTPELLITSTENPEWSAIGRLLTSNVDEYHEARGFAKDSFTVEVPGGCWRGVSHTTPKVAPVAGGTTMTLFPNLSAPVQDAVVEIHGPIEKAEVVDSGGSFIRVRGTIAAGTYIRFDMATSRAWLVAAGSTTEVSGEVDFGGPRSGFEITPTLPDLKGKLTMTQASFAAGAGLVVTGRPAHLF